MGPGALRRRGLPSVRLILGIATQQDARSSQPHLGPSMCATKRPSSFRSSSGTRPEPESTESSDSNLCLPRGTTRAMIAARSRDNEVPEWIVVVFATAEVIRLRRIGSIHSCMALHSDVSTTMIYMHVFNRGPAAVRSLRTACRGRDSDDSPIVTGFPLDRPMYSAVRVRPDPMSSTRCRS